jgi:5'(3')-deoxyribonucleotidase
LKQEILLIDLDDTLFDLCGKVYDIYENRYGLQVPTFTERKFFNLEKNVPGLTRELVHDVFNEPGLFKNLPVFEYAVEALQEIKDAGINAFICSTPYYSNSTCASDKINQVNEVFGSWWGGRVILTSDKTILDAAVLVDDKPDIYGSLIMPSWKQLVYDQPHNQHVETDSRLIKWDKWSESSLIKLIP